MFVASLQMTLYAPWVHSLKEKRMEVRSLLDKVRAAFHVSAAEVASQDVHQTIVLGFACVSGSAREAEGVVDEIFRFIEAHTQAEITNVVRELF